MAKHRIFIPAAAFAPDPGGTNPPVPEPYTIPATNDFWRHDVLAFNDTSTKDSAYAIFEVPENYVGSAKLFLVWTSTATSGNVVWDADYRTVGGDDTTSLDQATAEESLTVTDAAPTATDRRLTPSMTATAANFAAEETVELKISRDGTSGSDTMAAAAILHGVVFEYADA